jgi:hypothetical protein
MLLVIEEARSKGRKARRGMMERFSPEIVARTARYNRRMSMPRRQN